MLAVVDDSDARTLLGLVTTKTIGRLLRQPFSNSSSPDEKTLATATVGARQNAARHHE
ncbi:MAG TPA: hypothetical protein VF808_01705 [Ktedonobacterales bacterium]